MFAKEDLQAALGHPPDLIIRPLPDGYGLPGFAAFLSTVTDTARIAQLLSPLPQSSDSESRHTNDVPAKQSDPSSGGVLRIGGQENKKVAGKESNHDLPQHLSILGNYYPLHLKKMSLQLFAGHCLLILEEQNRYLAIDAAKWSQRSVMTPEIESSLIGPRDSFVEHIEANLSMIRFRIRHEHLTVESLTIGETTQSQVMIVYMKGLAKPHLIEQIRYRLSGIQESGFLDTTQLGQIILDRPKWLTPFPLMQSTERPDKTVASLLEGRIAVLMNTSPTAVILPVTMTALYQTADDYYFPSLPGTFLRLIRFIGLLMTLYFPALYVAVTSVNHDVLRIQFMIAIAASREGVPYPAFIEVIVMMILLELINEATVRLPKVIGGTATIVGGLIIGTAAAQAHLISNIMIVITAATAIGSYTIPNYMLGVALRLCSYLLVVFSVFWGIYGMAVGSALILFYLCSLKSMDIPYLAPFSTFMYSDLLRDSLIRAPQALSLLASRTYKVKLKPSGRSPRKEGEKLL
ncbi:spore germination protein [Paenibacillus thalictri]|uniref:spore germination protein n=1 Tax=Paenibacillus thalictri TaxID=2527873 RepID=UPI0013EF1DE3|nr:spore germination protein [Paenibacillus thalictri]